MFKSIILVLAFVTVAFGAATAWSATPSSANRLSSLLDDEICPTTVEQQLVDLINDIRADSGRESLDIDRRLIVSSRRHANDMAVNDFLSHIGSDGSTYIERIGDAGYPVTSVPLGEMVGAAYTSPEAMVAAWTASDPHRAIMLSTSLQHIGAAYVYNPVGGYRHYYTIDFGGAAGDAVPHDCVSCCSGRVGDANSSGDDEPTIGDVSAMIDALFITGTCTGILDCLEEADVNQSAGSPAVCDDITIGDISILIDYLFISGAYDPTTNPSGVQLPDCF